MAGTPTSEEIATSVQVNRPFDLKYFTGKIPFRVDPNEAYSKYAKEHLQTAYDALHQDDFETAILHFKAVETARAYYSQSHYFLALTYFMLEDYEKAGIHMQACIDHTFNRKEDFTSFLDECCRRSVYEVSKEEECSGNGQTNKIGSQIPEIKMSNPSIISSGRL